MICINHCQSREYISLYNEDTSGTPTLKPLRDDSAYTFENNISFDSNQKEKHSHEYITFDNREIFSEYQVWDIGFYYFVYMMCKNHSIYYIKSRFNKSKKRNDALVTKFILYKTKIEIKCNLKY